MCEGMYDAYGYDSYGYGYEDYSGYGYEDYGGYDYYGGDMGYGMQAPRGMGFRGRAMGAAAGVCSSNLLTFFVELLVFVRHSCV